MKFARGVVVSGNDEAQNASRPDLAYSYLDLRGLVVLTFVRSSQSSISAKDHGQMRRKLCRCCHDAAHHGYHAGYEYSPNQTVGVGASLMFLCFQASTIPLRLQEACVEGTPFIVRTNAVAHEAANELQKKNDHVPGVRIIGNVRVEREQRKRSHDFGVGAGISAPGRRD